MYRTVFSRTVCLIAALVLADVASAQSEYDLAQIVLKRNTIMKSMLKSYFPLMAIKNGKSSDLANAAEAAESIGEGMTSSLRLFPEGTANGDAPGSRAKPEVWSDREGFELAAENLIAAASKLAVFARSGDSEGFKAQFAAVESACIGCHEFKPSGGGRFRIAK